MRRPDDMRYSYTPGQYEDVDLQKNDVIGARYARVPGHEGDPDIEALPIPRGTRDVLHAGTYIPEEFRAKDATPEAAAWALRRLRIPLYNQKQINDRLYYGLVTSYAGRDYSKTRHSIPLQTDKGILEMDIITDSYENSTTTGSAIIGMPGTGKSSAARIAMKDYPKAILHSFGDSHYVQIPIIRTTAYADSNMSSLFRSFARTIDRILDTGSAHVDMLPSSNVGRMCDRIIEWIQRYHIGAWIIEEISFFVFSSDSSRSFENIATIMEQTGIFVFATGNNDFYDKISGNLRQERRLLANFINMDEIAEDKEYMLSYAEMIWTYYMLPELRGIRGDRLFETIYEWTLGSVDMLTILLVAIQREYLRRRQKEKGVKPEEIVTCGFVEEVAGKSLSRMRELFLSGKSGALDAYTKCRREFDEMSKEDLKEDLEGKAALKAELERDLISGYNAQEKLYKVKETILMVTDNYTDKQIENAFYRCEKDMRDFRSMKMQEMVRAVMGILQKKAAKRSAEKEKAKKENISEMFEGLKGAMDDPGLQTSA